VSKVQPAGIKQLACSTVISTMRSSPTVARTPDKVCAPWLAEYLHEMSVFPNGKHDAGRFDRSVPRLVQATNTGLGHLRVVPKRGRKTETAGAGLRPRQGGAGDRRGLALLRRQGTSEIRTLDPGKMDPICCPMRVVVFYHRGMGEAVVRFDIFLWSTAA
jgi:hypothetical protein